MSSCFADSSPSAVYVRMALIMTLLGLHDPKAKEEN